MSVCSSTPPQDHGGYILNSGLLESDLKVTKCKAMPFLRTCMRQMDMILIISLKTTAGIEITEQYVLRASSQTRFIGFL